MGSLERRLEALEAQRHYSHYDIEGDKAQWLAGRRLERNRSMPEDVRHSRDAIRLYRTQNKLSDMSADELIERIVSWPPMRNDRSRSTAEREVALAIYYQEPGTENMVCPGRWRESLEAGDELRKKYGAIPDEVLAEGYVCLSEIKKAADEEALWEWSAYFQGVFGVSDELLRIAVGPDIDEITEAESTWRLHEYLADAFYGERAWRIHRHMCRLVEEAR